jgi:ligand-binding sensor domain-containing protein/signal transduction histidine kinase
MNDRDFLALPRNPARSVTAKQSELAGETACATHAAAALAKVRQTPACGRFFTLAVAALLVASSLRAAMPPSGLPGYSSRVWHIQDGLPEGAIQALAQTHDGYLWIGTSGGLVRFDGVRFTVFSRENTPVFRENSVSALLTAKDGALWIGTQGGGVLRYFGGRFQGFGADDGLSNEFVGAVYQDRQGDIWAGTEWGLFRLQQNRFVRMDSPGGRIPAMWVYGMTEDRQGRMWVAGAGLVAVQGERSVVYYTGRRNEFFRPVMEAPDGSIWAGSIIGLERLDPGATEFRKAAPRNCAVKSLVQDSSGNLWAGTTAGLILYRQGRETIFSSPDALPDNQVSAILEDSEHNLWFGTGNGLVRWSPTAVTTVKTQAKPNDDNIRTVYRDRQGTIWVTANSGRIYILRDGAMAPANLPAAAEAIPARNVFEDSAGRFWIGTDGLGVICIDRGKVTRYASSNGGPSNGFTTAFAEDREGGIWIGTEGGLARFTGALPMTRYHPLKVEFGPGFQGLPYATIRALLIDRAGDLWIGTDGGLARLHAGAFAYDPIIKELRNRKIWAIHEDPHGGIWLGTRGDGLFQIQGGKLIRLTTANGLPSNYIYQILGNGRGAFWLASPSGVFSTYGTAPGESHLYGAFDGVDAGQLAGSVQPAGAITESGDLWFPSSAGVVHLEPARIAPKKTPPVLIEEVIADGRQLPTQAMLALSPGDGELEIHYTAVRLGSPEGIRFRYRLQPFDSDWVEAVNQRFAHYTNLSPGTYTFRVQAYDSSAPAKSTEASLGIRWKPHFYRSWWFFALLAAGIGGTGWQFYRARVQQHALRAAVLEERNRLAREMHDTLLQGCVGAFSMLDAAESLQTQSRQRAQELVGRAREQIRATIDEARDAIWNLRSKSDENFGARLTELAHSMSRDNSIAIRLHMKGRPDGLAPSTEDNLLLVAREALLNALRHAAPTRIDLDLRYSRSFLEMKISDNGCGFAPVAAESNGGKHYGLIGMRERAEALGGSLSVISGSRKGTVVGLRIPIDSVSERP